MQVSVAPIYVMENGEDGQYEVTKYVAECSTARGEVFFHDHVFSDADKAWELAAKIQDAVASNPDWTPVDREHWFFNRNAYGSQAYSQVDEHSAQRLDVENEFGPGSYGPQHPGYLKA